MKNMARLNWQHCVLFLVGMILIVLLTRTSTVSLSHKSKLHCVVAHQPREAPLQVLLDIFKSVTMIDVDVQHTRDLEFVLLHSPLLEALTTASGPVHKSTLREVHERAFFRRSGQRVAALRDLCSAGVVPSSARASIEIKWYVPCEATDSACRQHMHVVATAFVNTITRCNWQERVVVMSKQLEIVRHVRSIAPNIPIAGIIMPNTSLSDGMAIVRDPLFSAVTAEKYTLLRHPALVKVARKLHKETHAWVVDEPQDAKQLASIGVDCVVSNRWEEMKALQ
eukprot:TRINITY_DN19162_c0_g1_i1.p1 TRINITY_DN19162_c0_g1~~TRINITY_DN19162_c0_g1_i1.p1  ORF type:complete len:281 (+),score=31.50 TRINITY_DN19162_c0_g1_i1:103-945(+)